MQTIRLTKPLEKTIQKGHPWIFRDALENFDLPVGSTVSVLTSRGEFCCTGLVEEGPIGIRVFHLKERDIDFDLLSSRIYKAFHSRKSMYNKNTNSLRLIHGEGDFLPGIILDKYDKYGVLYFDGSAILSLKDSIIKILQKKMEEWDIQHLLLRIKKKHAKKVEAIFGTVPNNPILIHENGMKIWVDLVNGQKTGFFLDHRDSRFKMRELAKNKKVLNLYSYTGGFSISCGIGQAKHVTSVDIAKEASKLAEFSWRENNLNPSKHQIITEDVPEFLNHQNKSKYDLIIADPPSFAPNHSSVRNAMKAYALLHSSIFKILLPGGHYLAASCSSHINRKDFKCTIETASQLNGSKIQILEEWGAAKDHPVRKGFPEGEYLKVILLKKITK
jgi:23S rRNA (cytosine1962-C5)-methyltransferase